MFWRKPRHPLELHAEAIANTIQHQLTRLNLAYRVKRGDAELIQRVEFVEPLIVTPSEIRLEIDVNRLPRAVTIADLRKAETLETVATACKHPVRAEAKKGKGGGFWYVVELEERSTMPKLVRYAELVRPPDAAPLAIPIGVGEGKRQRWDDLRDLPHLLIAGATKQGKSVMVNTILCALARRLGPERLQLYLCDLKGGMELAFYEELPQLKAFVTRAHELPAMLLTLQAEMERRTTLLRGTARDLDGYNAQVGKDRALPYLVVVIDEIANAMLCKDRLMVGERRTTVKDATETTLADLAARARATGIHLIISTQRPSVDVVTGLIKANFPCRIAFGTASEVDSRVIVDDSTAHGLPPGRMRYRRNMELLELQAPFLSDAEVRAQVRAICAGDLLPEAAAESSEDRARREIGLLLSIADADCGGSFPVKTLARHARVQQAGISFQRVEGFARRLEEEGLLLRRFGPRARSLVPRTQWARRYPLQEPP